MKLFANKKLFKKIVILLVFITLVNALIPLHMVSADADEDFGGALFRPICQFFAGIGDLVMSGLQWIFIGDGQIKTGEIPELQMSNYAIRYSPGIIFSNEVPGLDANFIKPGNSKKYKKLAGEATPKGTFKIDDDELIDTYGFDKDKIEASESKTSGSTTFFGLMKTGVDKANIIYRWNTEKDKKTYILFYQIQDENIGTTIGRGLINTLLPFGYIANELVAVDSFTSALESDAKIWTLYEIDNTATGVGEERESTAAQLQKTVSKWYKALRMVSLVALLSVLVYIGIRIIISSTGQEKAKYKKMIGDWVVAICILFILNYIMAFTMDIISKVTTVFTSSNLINEANEADILMSGIRNNINSNEYSGWTTFTYLVLYLVLVIYTVIFTIHYLKRLVYLAFFTMIAPLIAVTYPIDRIKDGQAQAFGTWIKEYTFNAAIPVIHIIIYSALVGSAADLAQANPLFAIICISFLIPAEKFFRKLFGFDKATTSSQLGAAAGGALIMNAINKMGAKSGKQAAAKVGASAAPRTSGGSRYIAAPSGGAPGGNGGTPTSGGGSPVGGAPTGGGTQAGGTPPGGIPAGAGSPAGRVSTGGGIPTVKGAPAGGRMPTGRRTVLGQKIRKAKGGNIAGVKGVTGRYVGKAGRLLGKAAIGGAGAVIAGSAGAIAGISTGDFSNAFKYGITGASVGFSGANYATSKAISSVTSFVKDSSDTFEENKWTIDGQNIKTQVEELSKDQEFDKTCKALNINKQKAIRQFISNGITDPNDIKKAMSVREKEGASQNEIIAAQKIRQQAQRNNMNRQEIRASLASSGLSNSDVDRAMNLIDML